jgi:hypothetical protein
MGQLVLKRAAASRLSGGAMTILADGIMLGRIMKSAAAPVGQPWL